MAGKKSRRVVTKKRSTRRKTLRRRKSRKTAKKGGADSQSIIMPDTSFGRFVGSPENTANSWYGV